MVTCSRLPAEEKCSVSQSHELDIRRAQSTEHFNKSTFGSTKGIVGNTTLPLTNPTKERRKLPPSPLRITLLGLTSFRTLAAITASG